MVSTSASTATSIIIASSASVILVIVPVSSLFLDLSSLSTNHVSVETEGHFCTCFIVLSFTAFKQGNFFEEIEGDLIAILTFVLLNIFKKGLGALDLFFFSDLELTLDCITNFVHWLCWFWCEAKCSCRHSQWNVWFGSCLEYRV